MKSDYKLLGVERIISVYENSVDARAKEVKIAMLGQLYGYRQDFGDSPVIAVREKTCLPGPGFRIRTPSIFRLSAG